MDNLLDLYIKQEVATPMVIFFMLFAMGIAIFHTVIFAKLLDLNFRKWLFFVLNPALIGLSAWINKKLALVVFFLLVISVFLFAIIGAVRSGIVSARENRTKRTKFNAKYNIKPTPLWKKIAGGILALSFFYLFTRTGPYALLLLFLIIPLVNLFLPGNKNRYLRYQRTLPTSKIRSVAMGLAEIEGELRMIEPVLAPVKKKECIGYQYRIEDITKDKDGKESYRTVFNETVCNPFFIEDETGSIEVNPEKIEFVWIEKDEQYRRGGKRYTQYLLNPGDQMLLIGKASLKENNQPVFEYENIKKVFAISPSHKITYYNTYRPLLNSFIGFTCIFAFIAAIILITPMRIEGEQIIVENPVFHNPFGNPKNGDISPDHLEDEIHNDASGEGKEIELKETEYERNDMVIDTFVRSEELINHNK
ncbi:hypothetical protein [Sinomicrobium sp. M5D2P9]